MQLNEIMEELQKVLSEVPVHGRDLLIGSMTTTPHPLAKQVFEMFQNLNINDEELYAPLRALEREAVRELGSLLGCNGSCDGYITTGGSESNLAALYLAREHGFNTVYFSRTAHHSVTKAAHILGLRAVEVKDEGFKMSASSLRELCSSHGPGVVVVTVGTTSVGTIDPVEEISEVAEGCSSVVHVDAALGGLVAPFIYPQRRLGFQNSSVVSVTVDPHKLGLVPIPAGGLVVRDEEWFSPLKFEAAYYPAGYQVGLLGTRSAGPPLATWAMLKYMGVEGYSRQARELMKRTGDLVLGVKSIGFSVAAEPEVPVVCVSYDNDVEALRYLKSKGVYAYRCGIVSGLRFVIMPHVTDSAISRVLAALRELPPT